MPGEVCTHAACTCRLDGDTEFCSDACKEDHAHSKMDDCRCGHDRCRTEIMQDEG